MKKSCFLFLTVFLFNIVYASHPADSTIKRILFLGNSITYAGNYITDIETYLTICQPQIKFEFINAGLPSETVSGLSEEGHAGGQFPRPDLHERLDRVLAITHPDIVYACYGMNDGIYLPFDESRFEKFKDGILWLHEKIIASGAKIIHVTPPVYDELKGKKTGYAHTLDEYSNWIISQKRRSGWEVVNLHDPMKNYLAAHRRVDARFHMLGFAFAEDGVHPNEMGHWMMAKSILLSMHQKAVKKYPNLESAISPYKNSAKIYQLIAQKQIIMKDAWLTASGHTRPGMKTGMPLSEAKNRAREIEEQIGQLIR